MAIGAKLGLLAKAIQQNTQETPTTDAQETYAKTKPGIQGDSPKLDEMKRNLMSEEK